jgi:hypothetical protein
MHALGRPLVDTCCTFMKWRGSGVGAVCTQHYSTNRSVPVGHTVRYSADCRHTASAHGPCLNVNALVHTDGHNHVTGRTSGRRYASREYFDRPKLRQIPPRVLVKFLNMVNAKQTAPERRILHPKHWPWADRECANSTDRGFARACLCVCVCLQCVTERHHYYMYIPSVKGAQMFIKAEIQLKILSARSKF